jgi:hypothetical protein
VAHDAHIPHNDYHLDAPEDAHEETTTPALAGTPPTTPKKNNIALPSLSFVYLTTKVRQKNE